MTHNNYYALPGGHPPQSTLATDRAVFTEAYAVIPKGVMCDIVTSALPHWHKSRMWVLARPLSGFAETFSYTLVEIAPTGGSDLPEANPEAEAVIFVVSGELHLTLDGTSHKLIAGSYVYLAPEADWAIHNKSTDKAQFHWIRKAFEAAEGLDYPTSFVTHENNIQPTEMPDTNGAWSTTRFMNPEDMRYDMHVNIVNFEPGGCIPFAETHVMEHGLYILEGKGVYRLNNDWVEVEAGDFLWLRAFCPQACYAGGPQRFRYLLYKDVNRQMALI